MTSPSLVIIMAFVYCISNTVTGTKYIGKTINPQKRWERHQSDAARGTKGRLYHAMRKFGFEKFSFEIVQEFETEDEAFAFEEKLLCELKQKKQGLYNLAPGGLGGFGGTRSSKRMLRAYYSHQENRDKISKSVNESYKRADVRQRVAKKLTEIQVIQIRKICDEQASVDYDILAKQFNVSATNIWLVATRRTWKHAGA